MTSVLGWWEFIGCFEKIFIISCLSLSLLMSVYLPKKLSEKNSFPHRYTVKSTVSPPPSLHNLSVSVTAFIYNSLNHLQNITFSFYKCIIKLHYLEKYLNVHDINSIFSCDYDNTYVRLEITATQNITFLDYNQLFLSKENSSHD